MYPYNMLSPVDKCTIGTRINSQDKPIHSAYSGSHVCGRMLLLLPDERAFKSRFHMHGQALGHEVLRYHSWGELLWYIDGILCEWMYVNSLVYMSVKYAVTVSL